MEDKIAIDFETHLIGPGAIFPKPVCVSAYEEGRDALLFAGMKDMERFLKQLLESDNIIIAHNATFECGVIYFHFPHLVPLLFKALNAGRIKCTKITEETINVTREKPKYNFSLAGLVLDYFKVDISATKGEDAWRLRYSELEDVPLEDWPIEATSYAKDDSVWAYKLDEIQKKVESRLSVQSAVYLNIMAAKGMRVDQERVLLLEKEILTFLEPHYKYLIEKGFCSRQLNNKVKKEVKKLKIHVQELGVELKYTKKGGISTDAEALEFYCNQKEDKVLSSFAEIAVYEKVLTSNIANMKLPEGEENIYTTYATVKTTGRTSSSKSGLFPSLNIQQMPRQVPNVSYDIRNCFIPAEGKKILSIDYAGLELASTAHQLFTVYKKSAMKDLLNSGDSPIDLHSKLAARITDITYEAFMEKKKEYKDARQLAKPINLGFPGGIGYDTMRHQLWKDGIKTYFEVLHTDKSKKSIQHYYFKFRNEYPDLRMTRLNKNEWALVRDELVKLKRDFFDLYPELERFLKDTHTRYVTGKEKWIKNEYDEWEKEPMYRYDVHGFVRDWCVYTAFCNGFLMQSPSAAGAKKALNAVMYKYHDHPDIRPLAFIHDEILFEVNESRIDLIDDAASIMIDEMQTVLTSVRITVEASLSDFWQKADGYWTKQYFKDPKCVKL